MDNRLPIVVFNLRKPGNIKRAIMGDSIGTWVGIASGDVSQPLEKLT
jgi:uridylate kinase